MRQDFDRPRQPMEPEERDVTPMRASTAATPKASSILQSPRKTSQQSFPSPMHRPMISKAAVVPNAALQARDPEASTFRAKASFASTTESSNPAVTSSVSDPQDPAMLTQRNSMEERDMVNTTTPPTESSWFPWTRQAFACAVPVLNTGSLAKQQSLDPSKPAIASMNNQEDIRVARTHSLFDGSASTAASQAQLVDRSMEPMDPMDMKERIPTPEDLRNSNRLSLIRKKKRFLEQQRRHRMQKSDLSNLELPAPPSTVEESKIPLPRIPSLVQTAHNKSKELVVPRGYKHSNKVKTLPTTRQDVQVATRESTALSPIQRNLFVAVISIAFFSSGALVVLALFWNLSLIHI